MPVEPRKPRILSCGEAVSVRRGFGMDTSLVQSIADVPTRSVGVSVDEVGKPSFEIHAGSAWDRIVGTNKLEAGIAEVRAIYFGTLSQRRRSLQSLGVLADAIGSAPIRRPPRSRSVRR